MIYLGNMTHAVQVKRQAREPWETIAALNCGPPAFDMAARYRHGALNFKYRVVDAQTGRVVRPPKE